MLYIVPLVVLGGFALGMVFFGGLRATVAYLPRAERPALLLLASFAGRLGLLLTGLAFMGGHDLHRYLLAFGGILAARLTCMWLWGGASEMAVS